MRSFKVEMFALRRKVMIVEFVLMNFLRTSEAESGKLTEGKFVLSAMAKLFSLSWEKDSFALQKYFNYSKILTSLITNIFHSLSLPLEATDEIFKERSFPSMFAQTNLETGESIKTFFHRQSKHAIDMFMETKKAKMFASKFTQESITAHVKFPIRS